MSDVIKLPIKPKQKETGFHGETVDENVVLVCSRCGCLTHYINYDHTMECANCGEDVTPYGTEWHKHLPDVPSRTADLPHTGGMVAVTNLGEPSLARKRVLRSLTEWEKTGQLEVMVGYSSDGAGSHWVNMGTAEQKKWVIEKLTELLRTISEAVIKGEEGE